MIFILDTNIIIAFLRKETAVANQLQAHQNDQIYLCAPVYYEAMRGLMWKQASSKIKILQNLRTQFGWLQLADEDWQEATLMWADAVRRGRQLSDVDLLIAAIALRHNAIIVSDDKDFDALTVKRENWRQ